MLNSGASQYVLMPARDGIHKYMQYKYLLLFFEMGVGLYLYQFRADCFVAKDINEMSIVAYGYLSSCVVFHPSSITIALAGFGKTITGFLIDRSASGGWACDVIECRARRPDQPLLGTSSLDVDVHGRPEVMRARNQTRGSAAVVL